MPRFSFARVSVRTLAVAALLPLLSFADPQAHKPPGAAPEESGTSADLVAPGESVVRVSSMVHKPPGAAPEESGTSADLVAPGESVARVSLADNWKNLKERAALAERAGSFKEAESLLRSALAALRPDQKAEAVLFWNNIAAVDYNARQSQAAVEASNRALALNQELAHPDEEQSAVALNNLGTIAGEGGNPSQAWLLLQKARTILVKIDQADTRTAALLCGNLALTAQQLGNTAEAARLYTQAVDQTARFFSERSIEYARILANEAFSDLRRGAYIEGASHARSAFEIERGLPFADARDLTLSATHLNLALSALGQLAEAESWAHTALDQAVLQPGLDLQVCAFNNLAAIQEKQGKFALAAEAERRAIALLQSGPGKVSDVTAISVWTNMGRIAKGEGQTRQAHGFFTNAVRLGEKIEGPGRVSYAAALTNVADFESGQKHHKQAETLYRQALEIDRSLLGEEHPQTASDESNVATQLAYLGKRAQALELYTQARDAMQKKLGSGSSEVARVWRNMAVTYYSDKQFDKSAEAYAEALRVLDRPPNLTGMRLAPLLHEYASALRKAQRFAEAETIETRAVGLEVRGTLSSERPSGKS